MTLRLLFAGLILASLTAGPAVANQDLDNFYLGGGVANNTVGNESAVGYQFIGGYDFGTVLGNANLMAEVGYWNSGTFGDGPGRASAKGLWSTAVASLPLTGYWSLLGRAGLDFGDDDGLIVGIGAAYRAAPQLDLRGEIVARDNVDSFQFNVLYRF